MNSALNCSIKKRPDARDITRLISASVRYQQLRPEESSCLSSPPVQNSLAQSPHEIETIEQRKRQTRVAVRRLKRDIEELLLEVEPPPPLPPLAPKSRCVLLCINLGMN